MFARLQHGLPVGSEVIIETSGDTNIAGDDETTCQPNDMLNGKLPCDTFQIATLNSSPRRCIHIEASQPPSDDEQMVCTDFPNWFDGTNGCKAYQNRGWCNEYGNIIYSTSQYTARQACCICGGGTNNKPRLQVGDYVKLTGHGVYDSCQSLKIVEIGTNPQFHYLIEVMKSCGRKVMITDGRGFTRMQDSFQPGIKFAVTTDDPSIINRHTRIELKKCRGGSKEQEFALTPAGTQDGSDMIVIRHVLTGIDLASTLGAKGHSST